MNFELDIKINFSIIIEDKILFSIDNIFFNGDVIFDVMVGI